MSELVPAVIGVVGTLAGTVLGVTIQRWQQRAAMLQDARLALYSEVFIALASSERWIARMTGGASDYDPIKPQQGMTPDLGAISGRVLLLSTAATRRTWQEYLDALHDMQFYLHEHADWNRLVPSDTPPLVRLVSAVEDAYRAVRAEAGLKANT
ncbi:hypothetical protein [Micromonospora carbonacea]|uniref:hypothetical protein n=1 Tax=Micromonospora carbonacea TaxID=47853 RepID=UPI00114C8947|nr:hypothetical protein [Micromonospora carbonacea]